MRSGKSQEVGFEDKTAMASRTGEFSYGRVYSAGTSMADPTNSRKSRLALQHQNTTGLPSKLKEVKGMVSGAVTPLACPVNWKKSKVWFATPQLPCLVYQTGRKVKGMVCSAKRPMADPAE